MTMVTLRASLHAPMPAPPPVAALPLLDASGAGIVLGDFIGDDGLPAPLVPTASALFGPRGVCFAGPDGPFFVSDTGHHRLLGWSRVPTQDNQPADIVIGQPDFTSEGRNAKSDIGPATLNMPTGLASDGVRLAVADAWNHRVLIWHRIPTDSNQPADLVLGQADFVSGQANRGMPLPGPETLNWCYGVTIAENKLYIADTGNRRVLVWNSFPDANGQPADLVLGQADMITRDDNAGVDTTSIGMRWPHAVVVHDGKVLVADAGNNRIMAWNAQPNADGAMASFVLGQTSFEANSHNRGGYHPNERSLQMPYGLAVLDGGLICADTANSRLVGYELDNIDMDRSAVRLSGQHGFQKKGDNRWRFATRDSLCWPFALAVQGQLVAVADTGNNRVMFWEKA